MWLNKFKIAIIEKDIDELSKLMDNLPELKKQEEIDQVLCLLEEATKIVEDLKDATQSSMIQIQKNRTFLQVTEAQKDSSLDIKS